MFIGVVLHLWEEGKIAGGSTDLVTGRLNPTASSRHLGEIVTGVFVLVLVVLLSISITGGVAGVQSHLFASLDWLWGALYAIGGLAAAQFIVVRTSGMKHSQFLGDIRNKVLLR